MTYEYVIEDNIPLPPLTRKRKNHGFAGVLRELEIEQSVKSFLSYRSISSIASRIGRQNRRKFTIRKENDHYRVWRVK